MGEQRWKSNASRCIAFFGLDAIWEFRKRGVSWRNALSVTRNSVLSREARNARFAASLFTTRARAAKIPFVDSVSTKWERSRELYVSRRQDGRPYAGVSWWSVY